MKRLTSLRNTIAAITVAASVTVLSCVSANAAPPREDDLYGTHDKKAIAKKKQQERDAKIAEEQAYINRMKKFNEKWGNTEQFSNDSLNDDDISPGDYARRLRGFENAKYTRPDSYYDYDNPNVTINLGFGGYWGNPYWGPYYGWRNPYYSWSWNWGWNYPYYNDWWWNTPYWGYYPHWGNHWGPGYWPGGGGYWPVYSKYNRHNTVYGRPRTGGGNYNNSYYGNGGRGGSGNSSGTVSGGNRYRRDTGGGSYNRGGSGSYNSRPSNNNSRPYNDTPVYRRPSNDAPSYTPSYGGGGGGGSSSGGGGGGGGRSGQGRR